MALFFKEIGLRFTSEKTAAAGSALCKDFNVLPDDNPDKALAHLRRLKDTLRLLWKDVAVSDMPVEYPQTPEEFLETHPVWYATAY